MIGKHGGSIGSQSKGKSRIFFWIDVDIFEHLGIHHPCTKNFYPSSTATYTTFPLLPAANSTFNIDFSRGFCKGKETRPKSDFYLFGKQHLEEMLQCAL